MAQIKRVHSYADALKLLGNKSRVKIGHNTELQSEAVAPGKLAAVVRLHGHPIAAFHPDGLVEYSNAGYPTVTTRNRLNQLSDSVRFIQRDWTQYAVGSDGVAREYVRSLTVCPDGFVITDLDLDD